MTIIEELMDTLKKDFIKYTDLVHTHFISATNVLLNHDIEAIESIIKTDKIIDEKEIEIEEACIKILATMQPRAKDLRYIIAILKINNDLERIGDLSMNIARSTKKSAKYNQNELFSLPTMIEKSIKMLEIALDSFNTLDTEKAITVCKLDDEVDNLKKEQRKIVRQGITEHTELADYYIEVLVNGRRLERICDLCTNIAEEVIYITEGEIIRHRMWVEH